MAGQPNDRRFVAARWPSRLSAHDRRVAIGCGEAWLQLALPDATLVGTAFEHVGPVADAPEFTVQFGAVPPGRVWRWLTRDGAAIAGDGWLLEHDAMRITVDPSLRGQPGPCYLAIVGAATAAFVDDCMRAGGILLHAAVFGAPPSAPGAAQDAVVVAGASHAGKTTLGLRLAEALWSEEHAFLWPGEAAGYCLRLFRERRSFGVELPREAPLRRLYALGDDREHTRRQQLTRPEAMTALWNAVLAPEGAEALALAALGRLVETMEVQRFDHCLRTPRAELAASLWGGDG